MIGAIEILKNNKSAFVNTECGEKLFIHGKNLHGALDGDIVELKKTRERDGNKSSEGKVVRIVERSKKDIVGVFEGNGNFGFVKPTNPLGTDIYIAKRNFMGANDGQLVSVSITKFPKGKQKAEGVITKIIGSSDNVDNIVEGIKIANDIISEFPNEVMKEVKEDVLNRFGKNDIDGRVKYKDVQFITIDGADAKDLDDAISVESSSNGYKLYVAIADVSHYIKTGTELDKEALKRGNSTYMVGEVIPMLPKEISNGLCSLNPDTEKLVAVCEISINFDGEVEKFSFVKSKIQTVHRMTYSKVNELLDTDDYTGENEKYTNIRRLITSASNLSQLVRVKKYNRGALSLDAPEPKIKLDDLGKVEEITLRDRGESERIIEDFMILANECTAKKIAKIQGESQLGVYRIHENPSDEAFRRLNYFLAEFGYDGAKGDEASSKAYQSVIEKIKGTYEEIFLQKITLMSLKQAKYSTEKLGHFGLASEGYSHFTSPIRRYADLLAHRIIFGEYVNESEMQEMCKKISKTERDSAKMEARSVKIKCAEYMLDHIGEEFDAMIVGISKYRIHVMLDNHVEAEFPMPEGYEFDEKKFIAVNSSGSEYNIGGQLRMVVSHVDMQEFRVKMKFNY